MNPDIEVIEFKSVEIVRNLCSCVKRKWFSLKNLRIDLCLVHP